MPPQKTKTTFIIEEQEDGNWIGTKTKQSVEGEQDIISTSSDRSGDPATVLNNLITHE